MRGRRPIGRLVIETDHEGRADFLAAVEDQGFLTELRGAERATDGQAGCRS